MSRTMNITQVKATLLALVDEVAEGEEIEITRHGRTVARLVPARGPKAIRGSMAGIARTVDPDDDLLTTGETWNAQ